MFIYLIPTSLLSYLFFLSPSYMLNLFNEVSFVSNHTANYLILTIFISGFLVSIFLLLISSTRVSSILSLTLFSLIILSVFLFSFLKSFFFFFFLYELFFLPSFIIVFLLSPNVRFIAALLYFTLWTQIGSLLVLSGVFIAYSSLLDLNLLTYKLSFLPSIFLVIGFGVKIPVWPFHFWLTKTHVEAPSFFSIYLSGFLVKTALVGLVLLQPKLDTLSQQMLTISLIVGIIDSSLKFSIQVDLKKLVAYTTVQEMNMLLLLLLLSKNSELIYVYMFILIHTLLSTFFFYFVDIIYKKYRSRTTNQVYGLFNSSPLMGLILWASLLLFSAFPFTFKFFLEIRFLLLSINLGHLTFIFFLFFITFYANFFFFKVWLNVLYGSESKSILLNRRDSSLFLSYIFLYILLGFTFLIIV